MANITTTVADAFIPEIWAQSALSVLKANIVLAKLVTKDTDVATFQYGDVLHVPYPGTFTAADKAADTAITPAAPSGGADLSVTLNKHKHVTFLVEDAARALANQNLIQRYTESAAVALATAIEQDLFALYSGFSQSVGTSGTDISASTVRTAMKTLDDAKISPLNRHLVISSKDKAALLGDSNLASYFAFNRVGIPDGAIGQLYGFTIWMSQLVPVVTGTPNSTKNIAFHPEAMILAMRAMPEPPAGSAAQAATVRDPDTGIVLRAVTAYNPSHLGVQVTLDVLYGVAELRDVAGVLVLS